MYATIRPYALPWRTGDASEQPPQGVANVFPARQQRKQQHQPHSTGRAFSPESIPQASPTAAKLFVGQLPFETDEKRLYDLFSAYGTVEHIHILRDSQNRSKGAAFVTYSSVEEADAAIFTLHNRYKMLANRMIQVSYAKNSPNISLFGARNAIAVHRMNPTNPVPDMANVNPQSRML
uniref:RRM domain-containing protein n=1 Tax=Trypanosoma congolense (strain IL3000) TaxID=1068625 RepID=G0UPA3_TRYCI|nr:conserved hypothetical protein [Trypanosoma congolense IL3000]